MRRSQMALATVVTLLLGLSPVTAGPPQDQCHNSNAYIVGLSQSEDRKTACAGAVDAISFLAVHGFSVGGPIQIYIVASIPEEKAGPALGYFDRRDETAHVLSFAALRAMHDTRIFGLPVDRELHGSLVAHEVSHVVASRNFSVKCPSYAAQEYIAYVTQLATMPTALRERILASSPSLAFKTASEINSVTLSFSPQKFAVGAYRHFARSENGAAFIRALLTGEVRLDHGFESQSMRSSCDALRSAVG